MNRALRRQQQKTVLKQAESVEALLHHGAALHQRRQFKAAAKMFQEALAREADHPDALFLLGASLIEQGQNEPAVAHLRRSVEINPENAAAQHNLGLALKNLERFKQAVTHLEKALELDPANESTAFHLQTARERNTDLTSPAYVQYLFNTGAGIFEENLVTNLGYDGPARIMRLLQPTLDGGRTFGNCLDLGCGTGLMGEAIAPYCKALSGVDIAEKMLPFAAEKQVYQTLEAADVVDFLQRVKTPRYDLVTLADVLVYIGDLTPLFEALKPTLLPGALVAFTCEDGADDETFVYHENERFRHGEPYVRQVLSAAGFEEVALQRDFLRREGQGEVQAQYWLWRTPISA